MAEKVWLVSVINTRPSLAEPVFTTNSIISLSKIRRKVKPLTPGSLHYRVIALVTIRVEPFMKCPARLSAFPRSPDTVEIPPRSKHTSTTWARRASA